MRPGAGPREVNTGSATPQRMAGWLPAFAVPAGPGPEPLTAAQVAAWRTAGVVVLRPGLLPLKLCERLRADAERVFDDPDAAPPEPLAFPSPASTAANETTLHTRLTAAAAQLLGVQRPQLRLTQSHVWQKVGDPGDADADQRVHMDYPNNSLLCPAPLSHGGGAGEAVALHLYLSDIDDEGGPTHFVPAAASDDPAYTMEAMMLMPGVRDHPRIQSRAAAEEYFRGADPAAAAMRQALYEREQAVRFRLGTVALYQLGVWHRGTPVLPGRRRIVQTIVFRSAAAEWVQCRAGGAFPRPLMADSSAALDGLVAGAGEVARAVLGFPPEGAGAWEGEGGWARRAATAMRFRL